MGFQEVGCRGCGDRSPRFPRPVVRGGAQRWDGGTLRPLRDPDPVVNARDDEPTVLRGLRLSNKLINNIYLLTNDKCLLNFTLYETSINTFS